MVDLAASVWRDFTTDGVPASGKWAPQKSKIRAWGAWLEGIVSAFTSNGGLIYTSLAAMNADLLHGANSSAWVVGDATVANNGIYRKIGASGSGSWSRVADLPYSFIRATDAGAGTANAIVATTAIPLPVNDAATLIALNITTNNTASPATVTFNGGSPLTIKTNNGNDVQPGYLLANAIVAGYVSGSTYRLISDVASAADRAAAETAASNSAASASAAAASAATVNLPAIVANTMLVANPGGTQYLTKTQADVRDFLDAAPYVATRTALKALDTTKDAVAYLTEANREGSFIWKTGDYSAQVTLDTLEGVYVKATAIAATAGCWVRQFTGLHNVKWFGAVGDNVANDKSAIDAAFAAAKAYGVGMYLPSGTYKYDTAAATSTWDFATVASGFTIEGAGLQKTTINVATTLASGNTALYWIHSGNAPQYDKVIKGLSIWGGFDGTVLTIGNNPVTDTFETSLFERFSVINSFAGGTVSEAVRLNFVLGCTFLGCRFGCYANGSGTNYGTALRLRQAVFNTFLNTDYGNAIRGIDFTDFGSYGNIFIGGGSENCNWNVSIRSGLATRNSWKGGRFSLWTQFAITATGGSDNSFENIAYNNGAGPATVLDTVNFGGVVLSDGRTVTSPAVPASTVPVTNTTGKTVSVRIGGGAYTVVTINSFGMSKASNGDWTSWVLPPGQTIAITYTSAPLWSWLAPYW